MAKSDLLITFAFFSSGNQLCAHKNIKALQNMKGWIK